VTNLSELFPAGAGKEVDFTVQQNNTTTTYAVTVSGGDFYIDGTQQPTLTLTEGSTYKFDQADSTNSTHPLRFSTTSDGTHGGGSEYTSGVTTNGTAGSSGAYTQIVVPVGAPTLYYYCSAHSGMGGTLNIVQPADNISQNGKAVVLNSDGTVTGIREYEVTEDWHNGTQMTSYDVTNEVLDVQYSRFMDVFGISWKKSSNYYVEAVFAKLNSSTNAVQAGTVVTQTSYADYNSRSYIPMAFDTESPYGVLIAKNNPSNVAVNCLEIGSGANPSLTIPTSTSWNETIQSPFVLFHPDVSDATNRYFICFYYASGYIKFLYITLTLSNPVGSATNSVSSFSVGAATTLGTSGSQLVGACYNSDLNIMTAMYYSSNFGTAVIRSMHTTDRVTTYNSPEQTLSVGSMANTGAIVYAKNAQRVVCMFNDTNTQQLKEMIFQQGFSGSNPTNSSNFGLITAYSGTLNANTANWLGLSYNDDTQKCTVTFTPQAGNVPQYMEGICGPNQVAWGTNAYVFGSSGASYSCQVRDYTDAKNIFVWQMGTGGTFDWGSSGTATRLYLRSQQGGGTLTTLSKDSNILGITNGAAAAGTTAKITIKGGIYSNANPLATTGPSGGSVVAFESASSGSDPIYEIKSCYDTVRNQIVVAYAIYESAISCYKAYVVCGSVGSGTTTWGTPVPVAPSYNYTLHQLAITYDTGQDRALLAYRDQGASGDQELVVISFSGTVPTIHAVTSTNNQMAGPDMVYDASAGKHVIVYNVDNYSNHRYARVVTVDASTNTCSIGNMTLVSNHNSPTYNSSIAYDSNLQKSIICWYQATPNQGVRAKTCEIASGATVVTLGTETEIVASSYGQIRENHLVYDSNAQKIAVVFSETASPHKIWSRVLSVSGTTITPETVAEVTDSAGIDNDYQAVGVDFDATTNKLFCCYEKESGSGYMYGSVGTISGTTMSWGSSSAINSASVENMDHTTYVQYDTNAGKCVVLYALNSGNSAAQVLTEINTGGLTAQSDYYVQNDGTLATTPSTKATKKIGKAYTTTQLNIEYTS